jgi:4-hydroxybenzoate polyprenyltransferase
MSFFPYSLMNASYVLIGSLIAHPVHFERMVGMAVVYLLAVGISAHSLDAMAPNKPWGDFLSKRQLLALAVAGLIPALALGLYYALTFAPLLLPVGVAELFLLLAYNLELFGGRFHTDVWFAFSWGFLPVIAGFVVQTNLISPTSLVGGLFGFFTAFIEINASRPYKAMKKEPGGASSPVASRLEAILKGVVASVLAVAIFLLALDILG